VHGHKFEGVINFDIPSGMYVTRWRGIVLVTLLIWKVSLIC